MSDATSTATIQRRQWGAERRSEPLSIIHPRPSQALITWGHIGIVVTILSWIGYVVSTIVRQFIDADPNFRFTMEAVSYLIVVTFLTFSALMYLLARQGALHRFREHQRAPRGIIDNHFDNLSDALTVLIPSYAEEPDVVRITMWSAALQEYPDLRVVLLIDDPRNPTDPRVISKLATTRRLPDDIARTLREPAERFARTYTAAAQRFATSGATSADVSILVTEYRTASEWLEAMATAENVLDHVSEFFVDQVLMGLASELRLTLLALEASLEQEAALEPTRLLELHRRLVWIFSAQLAPTFRTAQSSRTPSPASTSARPAGRS